VVDRGSTRHSARVDDELEKETRSLVRGAPVESRAEEWRMMEPAAEGEPNPDERIVPDELELRSLVAISLRPSAFPADRARLVAVAREEQAEEWIVTWLDSLPDLVEFVTVEDVWEHLGRIGERRGEPLAAAPVERVQNSAAGSPASAVETPAARPHAESGRESEPIGDEPLLVQAGRLAVCGVALVVGTALGVVRVLRRGIGM
jgi:hypothetical protein